MQIPNWTASASLYQNHPHRCKKRKKGKKDVNSATVTMERNNLWQPPKVWNTASLTLSKCITADQWSSAVQSPVQACACMYAWTHTQASSGRMMSASPAGTEHTPHYDSSAHQIISLHIHPYWVGTFKWSCKMASYNVSCMMSCFKITKRQVLSVQTHSSRMEWP